jgi:putative PIN family toxin of toxin-antitoxin system
MILAVLDTNIVLDLFVFSDPATPVLMDSLQAGRVRWIATQPMRDELERVLAYSQIVPRMQFYHLNAQDVMARFDALVQIVEVAPKVALHCKDADDQKFIDLAAAHGSLLISKDRAVLALAKRLQPWGVKTGSSFAELSLQVQASFPPAT